MTRFYKKSWPHARRTVSGLLMLILLIVSVFAPMLIADGLFAKMEVPQTEEIRKAVFSAWVIWILTLSYLLGRALE